MCFKCSWYPGFSNVCAIYILLLRISASLVYDKLEGKLINLIYALYHITNSQTLRPRSRYQDNLINLYKLFNSI